MITLIATRSGMNIRTLNANGDRSLILEAPEFYQFAPMGPGQTETDCLTEWRDDIDQKIRRLQRQRARVTQALTQLNGETQQ